MEIWVEVEPAYGRDYTNAKDVKADWAANKDFRDTASGQYTNKADIDRLGYSVVVRYAGSRRVVSIPRPKKK